MKLDSLDNKLLHLLDHKANLTFSELARAVKQGRDRVEYRIKKYEEEGLVQRYVPIVNHYRLGRTIYKNYLKIYNKKDLKDKLIKTLKETPNVFWIAETSGAVDLIFSISAINIAEFHQIQGEIFSKFSDLIISFDVYPIVEFVIFRRKYFKHGTHYFLIGGNYLNDLNLELEHLEILKILNENSRVSHVKLAERLNLTPAIIENRIEYLEKNKVILGYHAMLELEKINRNIYKAQFDISDFSNEFVEDFFKFVNNQELVTQLIKQVGKCRLEIEIEAQSYDEYNKVIDLIKHKFYYAIRNVEMILIKNQHFTWANFKI